MKFVTSAILSLSLFLLAAAAAGAQDVPPRPLPVDAVGMAPTPDAPDIDAHAWVLMDYASGQILAGKAADERVEPASLTKIMTDYVVSAEIAAGRVALDDEVFISEHAWRAGGAGSDGSTSFLEVNSTVALDTLLRGMIIQSGNDAAIALAEHVAGSEAAFAQLMNAWAERLGMTGTHFVNASGYPADGHYTTAHDMALLSRALIRDFPEDYAISGQKSFEWNGITQHNRNTLLWRDAAVDGIKTGHTRAAGYCLAASAKRDEQRMIAIVMGSSGERARADGAQALLNYGFRFYETHKLYAADEPLARPRLWKGATDTLALGVTEPVLVTVARGQYERLQASLQVPATLVAPFAAGERVGTLRVSLDGKTLAERPLVSLADAPEGGFFGRLTDTVLLLFQDGTGSAEAEPAP